ncbi:tRNA synthetase class II family protein [Tripterygium wilfordii]|uniref:tRNA synthetase class II family protein n=1 Tax=Tripterygium wilfordii TaxID=458696 RepID=A0A7J7CGR0_TRIWF|nr:tRNA synthetase class II family protein [Tripterygium wilfordii]
MVMFRLTWALHHPFTAPHPEDMKDLSSARALAYDMIGGGSLRIYRCDIQQKVLETIGISPQQRYHTWCCSDIKESKHHCVSMFYFLVFPSTDGGIAYGLDGLIMLLAGANSVRRDVIAFPKTTTAQCALTRVPLEVDPEQLKELAFQMQ